MSSPFNFENFIERIFSMSENVRNKFDKVRETSIDILSTAQDKACKAGKWIADNPQASVSIITSIALLLRASQSLVVSHRINSERNRINHTYYDRSSGHHWQLRRKLTNRDRAIIDRRKKNGDDTFDILYDLGVI